MMINKTERENNKYLFRILLKRALSVPDSLLKIMVYLAIVGFWIFDLTKARLIRVDGAHFSNTPYLISEPKKIM